jgi:tol-pal system protein YbgF
LDFRFWILDSRSRSKKSFTNARRPWFWNPKSKIQNPKSLIVLLVLGIACGSAKTDEPQTTPSDQRLAEIQTALTELLERLDVINDRIVRLEQAQETPRPAAQSVRPVPQQQPQPQRAVLGAQIAENYRKAIILYGGNRMAEARAAFQQVFDADPSGDLADNALFWIGETYYSAGDYGNASRFYSRVSEDYADQNKAPDALFKLGLAQEKTGDLVLARTTWQEVIRRYPYSSPAASAKGALQRIKY